MSNYISFYLAVCLSIYLSLILGTYVPSTMDFPQINGGEKNGGGGMGGFGFNNPYDPQQHHLQHRGNAAAAAQNGSGNGGQPLDHYH